MNALASALGKAALLCAIGAALFLAVMILRDPVSARFYLRGMAHPVSLTTIALAWAATSLWLLTDHGGAASRRSWQSGAISIISGAVLIASGVAVLFVTCVMVLMDPPDWLGYFGPRSVRIFIALLIATAILRTALVLAPRMWPKGLEA